MKHSPLPLQSSSGNNKNKHNNKETLVKLLRWHFGHPEFRGKQLDAIEAVLSGRDCFCLMPTGGGKSLCYQIPAIARKTGIVLVVCPLIALMENQVMALKEKEIAAEYLSSTQTSQARNKVYEDIESGKPTLRLLYVTPELLDTTGFMSKLKKIHARGLLNLIAIDEAHCISTWGHDFRPSYRKLFSMRNHFVDVPILALTATAVPKVQQDVINSLCLRNPLVLKSSFNRPNIFYEVRYKDLLDDVYADLLNILKSTGDGCAIIYCFERTTCDSLSSHLSRNGISSAAYHAGLNNKLRSSVLDDWVSSKIHVVVATVAFGMGIDRKDVRIVCHFNIPKSMEAFYQESGRAGRDQLPCRSFLYYGLEDHKRMEFILSNAKNRKLQSSNSVDGGLKKSLADFNQMVEYCEESRCRRKKILESFGEEVSPSLCGKTCDACKHPSLVKKKLEELATVYHNNSSRVFMSSSSDLVDREQLSEFWNRDEEGSDSGEDISDSDDESAYDKGLMSSNLSKRSEINQKIELLQRAEEIYYQKEMPQKKISRVDKNAISEAMREGSKQRILNSLKQAQQRLGNSRIEYETSASFLEDECYKKYGKTGKSFYYSQVASTVRWLSTASASELTDRLGSLSFPLETSLSKETPPAAIPSDNQRITEVPRKLDNPAIPLPTPERGQSEAFREERGKNAIVSSIHLGLPEIKLPSVPSFSEFVNSRNSEDTRLKSVRKKSPDRTQNTSDKRMRLQ